MYTLHASKRRIALPVLCLLFGWTCSASGFTKLETSHETDGSQADVNAAIESAQAGDTIEIPAGSFTWGADGKAVVVDKAVVLRGAGPSRTTIRISGSGPCWGSGTIQLRAAATVRDLATVQPGGRPTTVFSAGTADGWRITNVRHVSAAGCGYFVYASSYGLIDRCAIAAGGGTDELIFTRGPSNSWQTASSCGTADAVIIEDCAFEGDGYVCDFNSNARGVVRFCTIQGRMKVDAHGLASNTPARGVRQSEVYGNRWTCASPYHTAIEIRGGTGFLFDNVQEKQDHRTAWFQLKEYGCVSQWPNFGNKHQTPRDYPIADQIGVGQDPKAAASEPMYLWNNRAAGRDWLLTASAGDLERAVAAYRAQTGNATTAFAWEDIRKADRDYFKDSPDAEFNGSGGIGRGTKSQMLAIRPTKAGVGFWVVDEGSWNAKLPANASGRLYAWNGTAWAVKYSPYTYPHPLRSHDAKEEQGAGR
jgi:hypothetical protein